MSHPVCCRLTFAVAEAPPIVLRFVALPEEARRLAGRLGSRLDPAEVALVVTEDERQATTAASMVQDVLELLPATDISLGESVKRSQLVNVADKLDFCVAMAKDQRDPPRRLDEVLVQFRRAAGPGGGEGGHQAFRVLMANPADDQDAEALVGLFTRALSDVLVTHNQATGLAVAQESVPESVGSADDAVARLLRELDAAGLAELADRVQSAFPEGRVAAPAGDALAA